MSVVLFCLLCVCSVAFLAKDDRLRVSPRLPTVVLWSFQKLGQPVIGTSPSSNTQHKGVNPSMFPKSSPSSGSDERRSSADDLDAQEAEEWAKTMEMRKQMQRMSLLHDLQSTQLSEQEKLRKIESAAAPSNGLLPNHSPFAANQLRAHSLTAGGLMDDWNFDIRI